MALPLHDVLDPDVVALSPEVSAAKSSLSKVPPPAPPPPPADAMVSASVAVPVPEALVAERVTVELPDAEGVPEMRPLAVFTPRPAGRPVAAKDVGVLVAAIW